MAARLPTRSPAQAATAVATIGVLVAFAACGARPPTLNERRDEVLSKMHAAYVQQLDQLDPAFVVVTYPTDLRSMPDAKRAELKVVRAVLAERGTPHDLARYPDSWVTLINDKHWRRPEYRAFLIPDAALNTCAGKTLLYLNLDVRNPVHTKLHPVAAANDIAVKAWNDPITLPKQHLALWGKAPAPRLAVSS